MSLDESFLHHMASLGLVCTFFPGKNRTPNTQKNLPGSIRVLLFVFNFENGSKGSWRRVACIVVEPDW